MDLNSFPNLLQGGSVIASVYITLIALTEFAELLLCDPFTMWHFYIWKLDNITTQQYLKEGQEPLELLQELLSSELMSNFLAW